MIQRQLYQNLATQLFQGKAIIIAGARQVGKTTLIKQLIKETGKDVLFLDGDDPTVRQLLDQPNTEQLRLIIGSAQIVFIDEAQRIPQIGITAKIITDQFPDRQLVLSGSSAFELNDSVQESLTGRKFTHTLFPISWKEWVDHVGYVKARQDLENRLVYGFYPDVVSNSENSQTILQELADSYLYKDVLNYAGIRKPEVIHKLVQALAYQLGQEVVYRELGELIGLDPKTVSHYMDVLEKAFVIFRLPAFSKNLRNEIKKNQKVYFYDNGIRNTVINSLSPVATRNDIGALWENFLISERLKQLRYGNDRRGSFFWRTKQQQEIDYVELADESVSGYEFKWNPNKRVRFPKTFKDTYQAKTQLVNQHNFQSFVVL